MKDVLIFGALVASVLAASIPMIQNFVNATQGQAGQINNAINQQGQALVGVVNGFANNPGGGGGNG